MSNVQIVNHLRGSIYHMLPLNNLHGVFAHRALLSKATLDERKINSTSIANEEVQELRSRIFVFNQVERKYRSLHSYVPFYFATHTPMLYFMHANRGQEDIVIFEVERTVLSLPGVLFTDGNASIQRLSKVGKERVGITPATVRVPTCSRKYKPFDSPQGTNPSFSEFYSDIEFLDRLDWEIIDGRDFTTSEQKRIKHAEVLVPDSLLLSQVRGLSVSNLQMVRSVNTLIAQYNLTSVIPSAQFKPELFF